jgi:pimeloyl-ACP methyl ester carboxylesterase
MQSLDLPVAGASLHVLRFGTGPRTVLAAHGITASAMAWQTVARALTDDWSLVAVDLRGRGGTAAAPGPFGMDQHAADLITIAEQLAKPVVLIGQSMGAYVALRAAVRRPDLFGKLVLVDGGLPLPVPPGMDADALLSAVVGPAVARLAMTFDTKEAYVDFFRAHPALAGDWTDDLTRYVEYDLAGEPGAYRSVVNADAVRADGRDMFVNAESYGTDLVALSLPTVLLYAPRGMLGQEPGLLPQPLVDMWVEKAPALTARLIPDTNHYTILTSEASAAEIAMAISSA